MTTPCSNTVTPTAQKTALLVASGSDVDELLTNVLASEGWSIQRVVDNQQVLALARAKPFDLIVTGRKTRVAEDVELLREIRSARPHVRRRAIACRVKDPGEGFSLEELRHAAAGSSPEDLFSHATVRDERGMRPGGFGILLAKKLVDELIYNEKGNEVVLVKYLNPLQSAII